MTERMRMICLPVDQVRLAADAVEYAANDLRERADFERRIWSTDDDAAEAADFDKSAEAFDRLAVELRRRTK